MPDPAVLQRLVGRRHPSRCACGVPSSTACAGSSRARSPRRCRSSSRSRWGPRPSWPRGAPARRRADRRARRVPAPRVRRPRRRASPTAATASRIAWPPRSSGPSARIARRSSRRSSPTRRARADPPRSARDHPAPTAARGQVRPGPLVLGLVLALAPPIPFPKGGLPNFSVHRGRRGEAQGARPASSRPTRSSARPARRRRQRPRCRTARSRRARAAAVPRQPGDLAAVFKDTVAGRPAPGLQLAS